MGTHTDFEEMRGMRAGEQSDTPAAQFKKASQGSAAAVLINDRRRRGDHVRKCCVYKARLEASGSDSKWQTQ